MAKPKILAVVGPTASGKTALSIELAKRFNGEVISADSRQVYRGLDIGSGKVTKEEMQGIPHHLIDIADIEERYTAADFARDAAEAIADITARGKVPIIAGGTFFYLDILRGKMQTAAVEPNLALQAELEKRTTEELFKELETKDPRRALTIEKDNRRRLIRALEIIHTLGVVPETTTAESHYEWLIFGIDIERDTLNARIEMRMLERLKHGMREEVEALLASGVSAERLVDFGLEYRFLTRNIQKEIPYEVMTEKLFTKIKQFAKRQRTWLKRDAEIIWKPFPVTASSVEVEVEAFLKK
jgi:tRNA dimethylallyltransferase